MISGVLSFTTLLAACALTWAGIQAARRRGLPSNRIVAYVALADVSIGVLALRFPALLPHDGVGFGLLWGLPASMAMAVFARIVQPVVAEAPAGDSGRPYGSDIAGAALFLALMLNRMDLSLAGVVSAALAPLALVCYGRSSGSVAANAKLSLAIGLPWAVLEVPRALSGPSSHANWGQLLAPIVLPVLCPSALFIVNAMARGLGLVRLRDSPPDASRRTGSAIASGVLLTCAICIAAYVWLLMRP